MDLCLPCSFSKHLLDRGVSFPLNLAAKKTQIVLISSYSLVMIAQDQGSVHAHLKLRSH